MELYNRDTAAADPHIVDQGGAGNVNVRARMEVPSTSQPVTSTPTFTAPPAQDTPSSKRPRLRETATMQVAMLVSDTIKSCHGDAMNRLETLVREWMQQDVRLSRERAQQHGGSPAAHTIRTEGPPPAATGHARAGGRDDPAVDHPEEATNEDGDKADEVNPDADDVEIWVHGDDE
ncbi:unnamed protein product [Closterium sp. Naga37s-1]|nr:unnamed protein product [Closterium sp. Naga37s-1]